MVVSNRLTYGVADSIPGTSTHHVHEIMTYVCSSRIQLRDSSPFALLTRVILTESRDKKAGSDQLNSRLEAFIDRHSRQSRSQPCGSRLGSAHLSKAYFLVVSVVGSKDFRMIVDEREASSLEL
ncbi:hypothetical protein CH063_11888 [Colletotrichum higginsianum]|uniref:Uncharacterized protein n=1 Tax=Colletotrichum higginsianum (strain IMI 349063) TaxID=759273 RepID=H1VN73_COLHI|nr:uncharacterized protein CH63R_10623 [Colletotrichum higginsianum IMI 349063]OBR06503.1 hypothetical protein CH63R_10623 [Colletotrichum higginsianum IMI 349063]CCF41677.1 hypothetical protein CH063_11888 [Colletotrichum higginsianum]